MANNAELAKKELARRELARRELARRELSRRGVAIEEKPQEPNLVEQFKEQPFKSAAGAVFNPLAKTLTGESLQDRALEATKPTDIEPGNKVAYWKAFLKTAGAGMAGSAADMATTPSTYIPIPGAKLLGKIPIGKSTLGKIASNVPISKLFGKGVDELANYQIALKTLPSRVAASRQPLIDSLNSTDSIKKIKLAIEKATVSRGELELAYTAERGKRANALEKIQSGFGSKEGFIKQLGVLKGELAPKPQFEAIENKLVQTDIDNLFGFVNRNKQLDVWGKVTASHGLAGLLEGRVPTNSQLEKLSEIFPKDFISTVLSKRSTMTKVLEGAAEVLNVPRALMTTLDMSAPLRQGVFLIGRPKQFLPAFGNMFKYYFDEKAYQGLFQQIKSRPTYQLMKKAKLAITDMDGLLTGREESFMSNLAEKIPYYGKVVRASDRAYTGFINKMRADVFDDMIKSAESQGVKLTDTVLKNIGNFVSTATGRGSLPGGIERASVLLNSVFFSPRLMASRMQLMNPAYYVTLDPFTRKEALKSLFTFAGTAGTVLMLAKAGGAKVGTDPRSADFGKIRTGNTRYDILGGFQQYIRLAAQLITGESVNSTTGVKTTVGEGYKPLTRYQILERFAQSKQAPVVSFGVNLAKGKNSLGQDLDVPKEIWNRFTPMVTQDLASMFKERGFEAIGMAIPSIFGVGLLNYAPTASEIVYSAKSIVTHTKRLQREGRIEEAEKLFNQNIDILQKAKVLSPMQDKLNKLEKSRKDLKNKIDVPKEKKELDLKVYDEAIGNLEAQMEKIFEQLNRTP
jgi:hypothetical protein